MSRTTEIREDYIHDRAVIVAPRRGKRPHDITREQPQRPVSAEDCPFCPTQTRGIKALSLTRKRGNWLIKTIPNVFPVVSTTNPKAYGTQEVIIETPKHNVELADLPVWHIRELLKTYQQRTAAVSRLPKIRYLMIFKNNGGKAGQSLTHAHSQVFASSYIPPHIIGKLARSQEYFITHGRNYYQDLIAKERRGPRWIGEDRHMVAFTPYASTYNYEAWILPKRTVDNIALLTKPEIASLARMLKKLLMRLDAEGLPYNYYLHQVPQYPDEHLYLRIAPRRDIWAGLELGSRLIVNTVAPEDAARFYRK